MPPKRKKPPATAGPSSTKARRSKLAKEHDITAEEEAEIRAAFALFTNDEDEADDDDGPTISTSDVRRCLVALDTPPSSAAELAEFISILDPDEIGRVQFDQFLGVAALKLHHVREARGEAEREEEVLRAFMLFTKGQEREITMQDLRRVAGELKEDVPDNVLRDMVREAKGGGLGTVGMEEFEDVMRRAGVFG